MRRAARVLLLLGSALLALGSDCGGDGSGGSPPIVEVETPDPRCIALPALFPAGFGFVPGLPGEVLIPNEDPLSVLRFDVGAVPFRVPPGAVPLGLPLDADGDGATDVPSPVIDDVNALDADLALVTTNGTELVVFADAGVALVTADVRVPASTPATLFPRLPAPGASALRTGVSTLACVTPPPGAVDSRGDSLAGLPTPASCPAGTYRTRFTSGAAVAGGRLFVTSSNVGRDEGTANTQYLPGTVLVFDVDRSVTPPVVAPHPTTPILFTSAFNPTHVTPYTAPSGREFVLVSATGAIGIRPDDPATSELEGGTLSLTDGAIDVVDVAGPAVVATIPLRGANPSFGPLAIDPTGRVAFTGDVARRNLYAVDLEPLDGLPPPGGAPVVLDGSMGANAVVFDGGAPFPIPPRPTKGAPPERCAGFTASAAVNDAGDRVYVVEQCDGTLTAVTFDLAGPAPVPVPAARFSFAGQEAITAAQRSDTVGEPIQPDRVLVRPGRPGVDFAGPDVFFTVGRPEGLLCGLNIESP